MKRAQATFIYVMAGLAMVAVLVTLYRGGDVQIGADSVTISGGASSATTDKDQVSVSEVEASQPELEDRIEGIERQLEASPEAELPTITVNGSDFSGTFVNGGLVYEITQFGTVASIVESSGGFTTAVGDGTITGDQFDFVYEDAFGGIGFGTLVLDPSGSTLSGQFVGNVPVPVAMQRVG